VGCCWLVGWTGVGMLVGTWVDHRSPYVHQQGVQSAGGSVVGGGSDGRRDTQRTGCRSALRWLFDNCVAWYVGRSSLESFDVACLIRRQLLKVFVFWLLAAQVYVPKWLPKCMCQSHSVTSIKSSISSHKHGRRTQRSIRFVHKQTTTSPCPSTIRFDSHARCS